MKFKYVIILVLALLASGCLDKYIYGEKMVPVLFANVTMKEINGTPRIAGIEAYAGEMSSLQAPQRVYPGSFPALYVAVVKNATKYTYPNGQKYSGPGIYRYTLGFQKEIDRETPMAVVVEVILNNTEYGDTQGMRFNWSDELQSKSFK